jgi:site-specific recombinase XerD
MTTLHDQHGHRKYLTPAERDAFLKAADDAELREVRTFCATLVRLWDWSRTKGWYVICAVMKAARITGPHATPKGLRHGFGIKAINCGVPLNTLQQLFGHAQLSTTAIYADAMGPGEAATTAADVAMNDLLTSLSNGSARCAPLNAIS